jgi:hypothetical protein
VRGRPRRAASASAASCAAILGALAGCGGDTNVATKPILHAVPAIPVETLLAAPEELKFGGVSFTVDATLTRDFMPISPPEGRPLAAAVTVAANGVSEFPSDVVAAYLWAILGTDAWGAWLKPTGSLQGDPATRTYAAKDGPLWGPGIDVDVVVGLQTSGGTLHLVKIPGVPIDRTD